MKIIGEISWQEIINIKSRKNIIEYFKNLNYFIEKGNEFCLRIDSIDFLDSITLEEQFNSFARVSNQYYFLKILIDILNKLTCSKKVENSPVLIETIEGIKQTIYQTEGHNLDQLTLYLKRDLNILFYGLYKNKIAPVDFIDWIAIYKNFLTQREFTYLLKNVERLLLEAKESLHKTSLSIIETLPCLHKLSAVNIEWKYAFSLAKTSSSFPRQYLQVLLLLYCSLAIFAQRTSTTLDGKALQESSLPTLQNLSQYISELIKSNNMEVTNQAINVKNDYLKSLSELDCSRECKHELIEEFKEALSNGNNINAIKIFYLGCYFDPKMTSDFIHKTYAFDAKSLSLEVYIDQLISEKLISNFSENILPLKEAKLKLIRSRQPIEIKWIEHMANDILSFDPNNEVSIETLATSAYLKFCKSKDDTYLNTFFAYANKLETMERKEAESNAVLSLYYLYQIINFPPNSAIREDCRINSADFLAEARRMLALSKIEYHKTYSWVGRLLDAIDSKNQAMIEEKQPSNDNDLIKTKSQNETENSPELSFLSFAIGIIIILTTMFVKAKTFFRPLRRRAIIKKNVDDIVDRLIIINNLIEFSAPFCSSTWDYQDSKYIIQMSEQDFCLKSGYPNTSIKIDIQKARLLFANALREVFPSVQIKNNAIEIEINKSIDNLNMLGKIQEELKRKLLNLFKVNELNNDKKEKSNKEIFEDFRTRLRIIEKSMKEITDKFSKQQLSIIFEQAKSYSEKISQERNIVSKKAAIVMQTYKKLKFLIDQDTNLSKITFNFDQFKNLYTVIDEFEADFENLGKSGDSQTDANRAQQIKEEKANKLLLLANKINDLNVIKSVEETYENLGTDFDKFVVAKNKLRDKNKHAIMQFSIDNKSVKNKREISKEEISIYPKKMEQPKKTLSSKPIIKNDLPQIGAAVTSIIKLRVNEIKTDVRVKFALDCLDIIGNSFSAQNDNSDLSSFCKAYDKSTGSLFDSSFLHVRTIADLAIRYLIMRSSHAIGQLSKIYNLEKLIDPAVLYSLRDNFMHRSYLIEQKRQVLFDFAKRFLVIFEPLRQLKKKGSCEAINTKQLTEFSSLLDEGMDNAKNDLEACFSYLHLLISRMKFLNEIAQLAKEKGGYVLYEHNGVLLAAMRFCVSAIGQRLRDIKQIDEDLYFSLINQMAYEELTTIGLNGKKVNVFIHYRRLMAHSFSDEDTNNNTTNKIVVTNHFEGSEKFAYEEVSPNTLLLIFSKANELIEIFKDYLPRKSFVEINKPISQNTTNNNNSTNESEVRFSIMK